MFFANEKTAVLLSSAYLAPIQYYTKIISYNSVYIEYFEHYSKQSYRNRCTILGTNGPLNLSIPVKKELKLKVLTKDIRIDNYTRWKQIHLRAIESAYRSSPYYIYYLDNFEAVYQKNYDFLVDLNNELQKVIMELMSVDYNIHFTFGFKSVPGPFDDFSDSIHPKERMKKPDTNFISKSYYQVFESRFGFIPNLSIVDLLFNMGPNACDVLKSCIY